MKLYIADGTYCGTQAEAKAISKQFEAVDVPVDKAGLIAYLNDHCERLERTPNTETIAAMNECRAATGGDPVPFDLDTAFEQAPLRQRLRLAVTAIDAAEVAIPKEWTPGAIGSNPCSEIVVTPAEEQPDPYGDLL